MLEILLHAGTEHPSLTWILIPSMLTFMAGLLIGRYTKDRKSQSAQVAGTDR